jgi:hypothetical protein
MNRAIAGVALFPAWSARRRALVITLISLCVWEAWEGLRVFPHPWGDLKRANYTDHFSHMNAARVFPRVGIDLWRRPIDQMFHKLTPEELAALPIDVQTGGSYSGGVFEVPGWPPGKPLVTSWSNHPRNYPPGDMLLVAPVAVLYHYQNISFSTANRLLLMLFLFYAHLALFFFFELTLVPAPESLALERARLVTAGLVYLEVIHWTLEGFYDAAALAPLVLCARSLRDRRGLAAMVAFCIAAFIHFRAFFFAPWAIYALVLTIRERQWRSWGVGRALMLALATALGAVSLGVFFILSPSLQNLPIHNFINLENDPRWLAWIMLPVFLGVVGVAARELRRLRAWLDLAVLGWLALMLVALHEAYPWHVILAMVPWLCAPPSVVATGDAIRVHVVRLGVVVGSICLVFGYEPFAVWKLWPL